MRQDWIVIIQRWNAKFFDARGRTELSEINSFSQTSTTRCKRCYGWFPLPRNYPYVFFLVDLILYVPVNNLSVTFGRVVLGWRINVSFSRTQRCDTSEACENFVPSCQARTQTTYVDLLLGHSFIPASHPDKLGHNNIWAATRDFQQCGILTWIDSDEPV